MSRCAGITRQGGRCERSADSANGLCWLHDPRRSEDRRRAASKAGKSKPSAEITNVKRELMRVVDGVLDGSVERGRGAVAAQLYGVILRALELERRIKETQELEQRISELEAGAAELAQTHNGGRTPWRA
jgi:hypothetical protein